MNLIVFKIVATEEWFGDAVGVEIDGECLIGMLHEFELPMAAAEGSPNLAGAYMGVSAAGHLPPSQHFLGTHESTREEILGTDILWCRDCGEPGCWPLRVVISMDREQVVWSGFEQPHRTADGTKARWVYDDFGPFTFLRTQYESSLNNAASQHS